MCENPHRDLFDVLMDPDNHEPIVMQDDDGKIFTFEQVLVTHIYDRKGHRLYYCILKPLDKIPGVADDETAVFRIMIGKGIPTYLTLEKKRSVIKRIAKIYKSKLRSALSEMNDVKNQK